MINKPNINRLVRDILRRSAGPREHNLMHPERDWGIGFGVALLFIVGGVYWAWQTHTLHRSEATKEEAFVPSTNAVYQEAEVEKALDLWAERKARYEAIKIELSAPTPLPPPAEAIITPPSTNNEDSNPDTPTPPTPVEPDTTSPNPSQNENPPPPQLEF